MFKKALKLDKGRQWSFDSIPNKYDKVDKDAIFPINNDPNVANIKFLKI